ncbi:hypothetical protein LC605_26955 [Nostoc sp. CHAB 5836]|uniref:hypothetical protein n=1 Tax=Nostoc sp. CHAB 5836 TaxID=2780404 RepID=UPI001E3DB22F|nr:hypothetical protein [Nostoc sp. CHAB 5836]MCC5618664.1 hypothetical protein [Nostoc sp. CHAB 5836]
MAFLNKINWNFLRKNAPNSSGIDPSAASFQTVVQKQPATPSTPKNLAELEHEMELLRRVLKTSPPLPHSKPKGGIGSRLIWIAILIGIPGGVIWVANQPYPVIRRPVMLHAPFLLLPSYISMDNHYRQALVSVEQAEQLIEKATSSADLALGEQKLQKAQKHLDQLPTSFVNDWSEYRYWWYDSRLSIYGFNAFRSKVGQLEAQVFQEKNAQSLLTDNMQTFLNAKQQYERATTATDKQTATAAWQRALNQFEQIPGQTLAGKTIQNQLDNYKREFQEVVGLAAGNDRISALITAAQQFSWQAAKAGQNPPHTVTQWRQIENLWIEAIERLKEIPAKDVAGYTEAQKLLAIYEANLGQVKVRRQAETDAVEALEAAQREIKSLLASIPADVHDVERNRVLSQLQSIINQLEKVQNGTTVYLKAQELLLSANNKLRQLQVN